MQTAASAVTAEEVVVGPSRRMLAVYDYLKVIAGSESSMVITGESGTGKEVIATLIHQRSPRARRPFVAVSCALFSETLIESELFGHERGAFTGAVKDRPGRFEQADTGTMLIDDIDDVPLAMQVKLLRVLQNRTIERLGGTRAVAVNVRVIAGSKRDLAKMVANGTFREDLFYRLNVLPIVLPPLRERLDDIPALTEHFLRRFFAQRDEGPPVMSEAMMLAFMRYDWPGNVRELENMCERIAQTNICGSVGTGCLAASMLFRPSTQSPPLTPAAETEIRPISLESRLRQLERALVTWALRASDGNKTRAADLLQINRSTLQDRINRCQQSEGADAASAAQSSAMASVAPR